MNAVDVAQFMLHEDVQQECIHVLDQLRLEEDEHLIEKEIDEVKTNEDELRELEELLGVTTTNEIKSQPCSPPIQRFTDPGGFYIPITLGDMSRIPALCDIGAAVSILPLSFLKHLGSIGKLVLPRYMLHMANGSTSTPKGMLVDVPIFIEGLSILCDLFVLDIDKNVTPSIILGRPFLASIGTQIDMKKGRIYLELDERKVEFLQDGTFISSDLVDRSIKNTKRKDASTKPKEKSIWEIEVDELEELFLRSNQQKPISEEKEENNSPSTSPNFYVNTSGEPRRYKVRFRQGRRILSLRPEHDKRPIIFKAQLINSYSEPLSSSTHEAEGDPSTSTQICNPEHHNMKEPLSFKEILNPTMNFTSQG